MEFRKKLPFKSYGVKKPICKWLLGTSGEPVLKNNWSSSTLIAQFDWGVERTLNPDSFGASALGFRRV